MLIDNNLIKYDCNPFYLVEKYFFRKKLPVRKLFKNRSQHIFFRKAIIKPDFLYGAFHERN